MMRRDSHPAVTESVENGIGQVLLSKRIQHRRMREKVNRRGQPQVGEALRTNPRGFALINDGYSVLAYGISNGCCFTVIKGHLSRPDHQLFEMRFSHVVEPDDFDKPASLKVVQQVSVLPEPVTPTLKFFGNDIDDSHTIGNGFDERVTAPGRIYVYDGAGIGNQKSSRVSQPRWG